MNHNEPQVDQKRFVLAMVISGVVILLWQMYFAPEMPPVEPEAGETVTQTNTAGPAQTNNLKEDPSVDLNKPVATPASNVAVREDVIESDEIKVTVSNKGGRVVGFETLLPKQYQAGGDILGSFPDDSKHFPFGISFKNNTIALPQGLVYQFVDSESVKAEKREGYTKIVYRYVDPQGRFQLDKIYLLDLNHPYHIGLDVQLTNNLTEGRLSDQVVIDVFGFKDPDKESSFLDARPDQFESICRTTDDIERELISSLDNTISFNDLPVEWAGVNTRYFLFAAVPTQAAEACAFDVVDEHYIRTQLVQGEFSIAPKETISTKFDLYLAPKDVDILDSIGHDLSEAVDYGFFTFLARPMRYFLVKIYGLVGNWGFAILLLTIIIRLLMWPINKKVYVNSERMKDIQPQLAVVKEKYADDQQRMTEETMKVFKANNVSPLGCAPMFLQFPIFLSLYYMILNSTELYQADFILWYTDLSASDPYFVLPILMGVVMLAQQQMMTVEGTNPQMQQMMKFMPIMFVAFMLFLPAGVVLYYSASMLIGIAQQYWIKKNFAKQREAAA